MTIFYKKNPQILKSRVSEILMKSRTRSFNQVSVSTVTVSTASLWITHFLLGHSYTEEKWGTCLHKLSVMLPQNIFVTLNQIILYCVAVLKRAALQLLCCNRQRYYQPWLNMLGPFRGDPIDDDTRTFCGKFLYNAIASTDNAQHKNCPSSGIDDRPGRDLFRVLKRSPIS